MVKNQILTSSDHHANWDALEKLFEIAKIRDIPFVINGDIIGDYNFEHLRENLNLRYSDEFPNPSEITASMQILMHRTKLKKLYELIITIHAEKLAHLIDKYEVLTYFLIGNHEPIHFVELVKLKLKNKNLIKDVGKLEKIEEINGVRIAGIPNVCALMPFLSEIYSDNEINQIFSHQTGTKRPILFGNVTKEHLLNSEEHLTDPDWIRIMTHENHSNPDLDVFFSHGQIGIGAWRDSKFCDEMPTLHAAAALSNHAKITIDAHLHSTHEMKNSLGKETIRAVGNKGFLLTKNDYGEIEKELVSVDAPYDSRGKIDLSHLDLEEVIQSNIIKK